MQSSILILMLALGLPGANSCNTQQQGLPRVGQTPPVATEPEQTPEVADTTEAEEVEPMEAGEMEVEAPEAAEVDADTMEIELPEMDAFGMAEAPTTDCTPAPCEKKCCPCPGQGGGSTKSDSLLGAGSGQGGDPFVVKLPRMGGHVMRLDGNNLGGEVKNLHLKPGSTVILETNGGGQVVLRAQDGEGVATLQPGQLGGTIALSGLGDELQAETQASTGEAAGVYTLNSLFGQAQAKKQNKDNDDRVRELEQRVRELEAQLRERDGRVGRKAPRASGSFGYTVQSDEDRAKADGERAEVREMQEQAREMSAQVRTQAREYAEQARKQAMDMRRSAESMRKQAEEQAEQAQQWRARTWEKQADQSQQWKRMVVPDMGGQPTAPEPDVFAKVPSPEPRIATDVPAPPTAPHAARAPEPPHGAWSFTTPAPPAPRGGAARLPRENRTPGAANTAQADELRKMMEQMRAQMEEMREQMKALREELQNAPQRENR